MTVSPAVPYVRDRFTWLAYLMIAYGTYGITSLSPFMPFLAAELGMNYAERGLHTTAFALGSIFAGLLADRITRLLTRPRVFWLAGGGLALGSVLICVVSTPVLTVAAAFTMGFMGVLMLIIVQAALADHTGENRGIAISESTIGASVAGLMGPLLISQLAATTLGWRAALVLASLSWVLMFVFGRKITIPASPHKDGHHRSRRRLPGMYWLFWGVMLLGTAVEWSVAFWSPEYFEQVIGVERTTAAGTLTFFWLAFIVGRLGGSVLSRRFQPSTLLVGAAVLVLVAFPFLLLVRDPIVALGALFVMALGISNFFPMTLASALHAGRDNVDTASARVAIANGLAILIAPQVLGSLGDQVGIGSAYAMIGVLGAGVLALGYVARRVERREERRALLAS